MHRLRRRLALVSAGSLLVALASCGGGSDPLEITLMADGPAGPATVSYRTPDGEQVEDVQLPWEISFEAEGDFTVEVVITNPGTTGTVSCRIAGFRLPVGAEGEASARCRAGQSTDGGSTEGFSDASGEGFTRINGEPVAFATIRYDAPTSYAPRAFVITGETGWAAEGDRLTGVDAVTGEEVRSEAATGTNGAVVGPDGSIYAVSNNNADDPDRIVVIAPDLTERVIDLGSVEVSGEVAVVGDEIWLVTHDDRVVRLSASDGAQVGELATGDSARFLAAGAGGAVIESDEGIVVVGPDAEEILRPDSLGAVAAIGDNFLVVNENRLVEVVPATSKAVRAGTETLEADPDVLVVLNELIVASLGGTVYLVDAESLDPTCTISTSFDFLGASPAHLWFRDADNRDYVLYPIANLPC